MMIDGALDETQQMVSDEISVTCVIGNIVHSLYFFVIIFFCPCNVLAFNFKCTAIARKRFLGRQELFERRRREHLRRLMTVAAPRSGRNCSIVDLFLVVVTMTVVNTLIDAKRER
jgi:ABC-type phosphate transport system auxiliary subunit